MDLINNTVSHDNLVNFRTPNHLEGLLTKGIMAERTSGELSPSRDGAISLSLDKLGLKKGLISIFSWT